MACKMIAYYRVSTKRQGASGLGVDGQKAAVAAHVEKDGCDLVAEYTEVETGKKHDLDNRPALRKALTHAKRAKATLVVAKLDRLLRSTVVHALLKTSGVPFVCCDQPNANPLTLDILAAVAENEVREISKRTKVALARSDKALGGARKGHPKPTLEMSRKGGVASAKSRAKAAVEAYTDIVDQMRELQASGLSLRAIAARLTADGHQTVNQKPWNPMQVARVLKRAA